MRTLFLFFLLLSTGMSMASPEGPITMYFPDADTVLLARVTTLDQKSVSFDVTKTLRGSIKTDFTLQNRFSGLKAGSEYVLLSCASWRTGQHGNAVGSFLLGDIGWIYASVRQEGAQTYVYAVLLQNGHSVDDKEFDGLGFLTLPHIESLLRQTPRKL
jgi:hypothetical protein